MQIWGRALAAMAALLLSAGPAATERRDFSSVDAHALAAPRSASAAVESLASYLGSAAGDDTERARAAFTWIAHNVAYDLSLRGGSAAPELVLAQRRAVCAGYSALFEALVEAMGLEAEVVEGHGKGRSYRVGESISSKDDHAWNAVRLEGKWGLVDCTWGAGYVDERGHFWRRFNPHYFLTPPEAFVCDHFPEDSKWQLLREPMSAADYLNRARVKPTFFEWGLKLISHREAQIEADASLAVKVGAPQGVMLTARLMQHDRELDARYCLAQREGDAFVINAMFPARGSYVLRVYVGDANEGGDLEWSLDYLVEARSAAGDRGGFPHTYGAFVARGCRVERPLSRVIRAGSAVEFSVAAPGAEGVMVMSNGLRHQLAARGDRFSGTVSVGRGDVLVFAKFPGKPEHEALLHYHAR